MRKENFKYEKGKFFRRHIRWTRARVESEKIKNGTIKKETRQRRRREKNKTKTRTKRSHDIRQKKNPRCTCSTHREWPVAGTHTHSRPSAETTGVENTSGWLFALLQVALNKAVCFLSPIYCTLNFVFVFVLFCFVLFFLILYFFNHSV